jgi:hypothetical protein
MGFKKRVGLYIFLLYMPGNKGIKNIHGRKTDEVNEKS